MGVEAIRPTYNLEPKYRVNMLTREDWTKGSGAPPEVKGLVWYTDGSKMREGTRAGVFGQYVRRRLSFSLGRYTTVFQAEYTLSWSVSIKFNLRTDRRNTVVYALIVKWH